ncbi:MAG: hypothetical protein EOM20_18105 [Spartobacteria bacterium]|nr:hypothetical protein [Spartobacteria bacterium]
MSKIPTGHVQKRQRFILWLKKETVRQLKRYRMLYVDLLEIKTADDLCKRMVKALISMEQQAGLLEKILKNLAQLRPVISIDPLTGQPTVSVDAGVRLNPNSLDGILDLVRDSHKRMRLVVVGITSAASIKKALNRLVQLKVVYRHQGEYKFVNPFFKSWLLWKNY